MTKWITLRARFPEEELEEIDRIQKKYKLSYNEIIRSGVKFYIGVTLAKEILASTTYGKKIKILNKDLSEILTNPRYQANLEEKISKLARIAIFELLETGLDFKERTKTIRKKRKVGRPKRQRKVGRPSQYE